MKNLFLQLTACVLMFNLTACQDKAAQFEKTLSTLDKEMTAPNGEIADVAKANQFISTVEQYASLLEKSNQERYAELSLKAAGLAVTISEPGKALTFYNNVAEKVPNHTKAPMALFMTGFVYENYLKDNDKAKAAYEAFLKRYPNDPDFADDAQNCLKLLGKTPEEVFQQFEKQNQETPQTK